MKILKYLSLKLILILFISFNSIAQKFPTEWTTYYNSKSILIEYKESLCDPIAGPDQKAIYLKFTNLTSETITVSWHSNIYRNGKCRTCNEEEYNLSTTLKPNEKIEGFCDPYSKQELRIFSKFTDKKYYKPGQALTKFELTNIKVSQSKTK